MELEAEFTKFWEYYPKKKAKGDAYKAWVQTKEKRPALATVLKAIVVLRDSPDWLRESGQYIPYPATWLRHWGWADVAEEDQQDVIGDKLWWKTVSGVQGKAKELGMEWDALNGETFQQFTERVKDRARDQKIVPMVRTA